MAKAYSGFQFQLHFLETATLLPTLLEEAITSLWRHAQFRNLRQIKAPIIALSVGINNSEWQNWHFVTVYQSRSHMWPSRPKWVALLLVHFLGTATFPKGVPCIDFGFSTESVSPVFSTSEKYTCYTHKKVKSVICKCLKQATLQIRAIWWKLYLAISQNDTFWCWWLHCHNFKTSGPI